MKQYSIGLIILLALISTGCEDAKAESKDYDVEIAELQQQVAQLNGRLDSLIAVTPSDKNFAALIGRLDSLIKVVPTNTNIVQLTSRLDSTISVMPTRKIYEGVVGSDNIVSIDIPEIQLTDMPIVSVMMKNYKTSDSNGPIDHWRTSGTMTLENGRIYQDWSWTNTPNVMVGRKVIISIIK